MWSRGRTSYPEYHSSDDNLNFLQPARLLETLTVIWHTVIAMELNATYKPNYVGLPFLTGLGVYPHRHFAGDGSTTPNDVASAYYELLGWTDGQRDMIEVAYRTKLPIEAFNEAIEDFLRVNLIHSLPR